MNIYAFIIGWLVGFVCLRILDRLKRKPDEPKDGCHDPLMQCDDPMACYGGKVKRCKNSNVVDGSELLFKDDGKS